MTENRLDTPERHDVVVCCGRQAQLFWGIMLLLFGGVLLVGMQVSLMGLGRYLLPVFLLLWGAWKVWTAARYRQ